MLHKDSISNIVIHSPEWDRMRIGKFTSSRINTLMADKPLSEGALSYIYQKAGEFITGQSTADEDEVIDDENTIWGLQYEAEALNAFGLAKKLEYLVTQKLIHKPRTRFSSTPDALWVIDSSVIEPDCYNVATVEVKCPRKFPRFFPLFNCETPEDLKKYSKPYYFQVLDQMDNCDAVLGYFACYHPFFPPGKKMKIIEFKKIDLWDDFKKLQQRKLLALEKFNEIVAKFIV